MKMYQVSLVTLYFSSSDTKLHYLRQDWPLSGHRVHCEEGQHQVGASGGPLKDFNATTANQIGPQ